MELLVIVAIKLAKNLDNVGIGVGAAESVARAIKAKNEFGVFTRDYSLLHMGAERWAVIFKMRHLE